MDVQHLINTKYNIQVIMLWEVPVNYKQFDEVYDLSIIKDLNRKMDAPK